MPNVVRTWAPRGETPIVHHRYRRDKISAISAVSISARQHRPGFYIHLHPNNITHVEVSVFLRSLLCHLRGHVIVILDGGAVHKGRDVRQLQAKFHRLHIERLPGYAPELNPDEFAWAYMKRILSNGCPNNVEVLMRDISRIAKKICLKPDLIRSFVAASGLSPIF
jgi:transposase